MPNSSCIVCCLWWIKILIISSMVVIIEFPQRHTVVTSKALKNNNIFFCLRFLLLQPKPPTTTWLSAKNLISTTNRQLSLRPEYRQLCHGLFKPISAERNACRCIAVACRILPRAIVNEPRHDTRLKRTAWSTKWHRLGSTRGHVRNALVYCSIIVIGIDWTSSSASVSAAGGDRLTPGGE